MLQSESFSPFFTIFHLPCGIDQVEKRISEKDNYQLCESNRVCNGDLVGGAPAAMITAAQAQEVEMLGWYRWWVERFRRSPRLMFFILYLVGSLGLLLLAQMIFPFSRWPEVGFGLWLALLSLVGLVASLAHGNWLPWRRRWMLHGLLVGLILLGVGVVNATHPLDAWLRQHPSSGQLARMERLRASFGFNTPPSLFAVRIQPSRCQPIGQTATLRQLVPFPGRAPTIDLELLPVAVAAFGDLDPRQLGVSPDHEGLRAWLEDCLGFRGYSLLSFVYSDGRSDQQMLRTAAGTARVLWNAGFYRGDEAPDDGFLTGLAVLDRPGQVPVAIILHTESPMKGVLFTDNDPLDEWLAEHRPELASLLETVLVGFESEE